LDRERRIVDEILTRLGRQKLSVKIDRSRRNDGYGHCAPGDTCENCATTARTPFRPFLFSGMAVLMLVTVFVGFAPTYYLAGVFHAPLPSLIFHVHGAVFSCWVLLLLTQTSPVSAGRVDIHRKLGVAGFVLACLLVVVGVLAATDSLVREAGAARRDPRFFYIIPLTDMLVFATLVYFAFRNRFNAAAHKRLLVIATTGLMIAAIARWPWAFVHRQAPRAAVISYLFLLILMAYDLWSTHKVHRATLWGSAFLIFVYQIRLVLGKTEAWLAFAGWVQGMAR
jgi:FtsH-binding integral membrane protein